MSLNTWGQLTMHEGGEKESSSRRDKVEMGFICDRRIAAKVKGNVYRMIVRPVLTYGVVTVALTKKDVQIFTSHFHLILYQG